MVEADLRERLCERLFEAAERVDLLGEMPRANARGPCRYRSWLSLLPRRL